MRLALSLALLLPLFAAGARAASVGESAPDFSAADSLGGTQTLDQHHGRIIVLEWYNKDCPFVRAHYDSGVMQKLQEQAKAQGVDWLTVISSAPGRQGYLSAADANAQIAAEKASPSAVLLDPDGKIGRLYGARTTPHMFVIDKSGTLVYEGAIDDRPSAKPSDAVTARNYVAAALKSVAAGQPIEVQSSQPYGCSVKYGS